MRLNTNRHYRLPTHTGISYEKKSEVLMTDEQHSRLLKKLGLAIASLTLITPVIAVLTS
jgi:hypothetical protein